MTKPVLIAVAVCFLSSGEHRWLAARELTSADAPAAFAFSLRDTNGATHTVESLAPARAVVLFFVMPDCPISQSYVPEMNRLERAYAQKGVRFFAVQSDVAADPAAVKRHVEEFGYRFPVLGDPDQRLVQHTAVTITPETVVMKPSGQVLYRGRIDNRIASLGTRRTQATVFDLRDALDAVLAGRPVVHPRTTAFGCIIPRRS
jgi:peroxiredoxin